MPEVFPMLPKIDRDEQKFLADRSGVWKRDVSSDFLTSLVNSLETGGAITDIGSIDSIPDVWARPLLFKMALFDIGAAREFVQGLHDKVVGEWRAILAMLALKNIKQINLHAEVVDLKQYKEDKNEFARVFTELIPRESFNGNADAWLTDIYVIFLDGKPLAMTSPVTLVASAADYSSTFNGGLSLPWSKDGKTLIDPIKNLSHNELAALDFWLQNLRDNLQKDSAGVTGNAQTIANSLLKCIGEYQAEVARNLDGSAANFNLVPSNLKLHIGTARYLNETIQGAAASITDSFVRIIANPERNNKKLILVSPSAVRDFAQQENVPAARFVVWQGISADNVTEASLRGARNAINQISLGDTEYRRPEDFFYDKIAVLDLDVSGDFLPGAMKVSGYDVISNLELNVILPIKRELLELFSPEEIIQRLSFTAESDHDISLHFDFPLSGVNGTGADFRFTKRYFGDDGFSYLLQEIPVIEIWPNIRREGWNKYYLYYENTQAQDTAKENVLMDDMYYVEPWTLGKAFEDFPAQGLKNRITARLDKFPEALIFNHKNPGGSSVSEIGVILLKKPELKSRQAGKNWKIGVDFGTSSTMLYFAENNPKSLNFDPHLLQITNSGALRLQTFLNFISSNPKEIRDGSFLSIFHLLNVKDGDDEIQPILDGHIMSEEFNKDITNRLKNLDSDLKWQNDNLGRRKVAAYIGQICLQVMVEAMANGVDKIQWNFSYPTAFAKKQRVEFEGACKQGVDKAYQNTGFTISTEDVKSLSESEASAYYFNRLNDRNANFTQGAICIDIGAGTTDITVISGAPGRVVYHTSVQYAGRYIFKPIYDNYELFNKEDFSQEYRLTLIDIDMRKNSDKYIGDLAFKSGQDEVQDVLQGCQLAVSGLFYYLGKIIGVLHEANVYVENKIPHVFIGGNGSRIFKWLTGGTKIDNNPYLEVLEKMLCDASGLEGYNNFLFDLSAQPKIEVACGMIIEKPRNATTFFDAKRINRELFGNDPVLYDSLMAGAEFNQDNKKFRAVDFISVEDVSEGITVSSLEEFEKFLACFSEAENLWAGGIELDAESAEEIIRETNGFYVSLTGASTEEIFLEPVFIVELKNLMEMLNYGD